MKKLIAIIPALIAAATFTTAAEAGFKVRLGFGGPLPAFTAYSHSSDYGHKVYKRRAHRAALRRQRHAPVQVTEKPATETVAKVEDKAQAEPVAKQVQSENSSISVAAATVSETKSIEPVKTAAAGTSETEAARNIGCKKFFPSVGMTVSVACE